MCRCIRNNLIIDLSPIVASLPETSVPLAIERIERKINDVKFDADG